MVRFSGTTFETANSLAFDRRGLSLLAAALAPGVLFANYLGAVAVERSMYFGPPSSRAEIFPSVIL